MYRSPHSRHRISKYYRENKNLVKTHQEKFKDQNGPNIKTKRRPKRAPTTREGITTPAGTAVCMPKAKIKYLIRKREERERIML